MAKNSKQIVIVECIIYFYSSTDSSKPPLGKERQRVEVDHGQPLKHMIKKIRNTGGLNEAAAKKGLGDVISITVGRIDKGKDGTKVFTINTEESFSLEKTPLILNPILQGMDHLYPSPYCIVFKESVDSSPGFFVSGKRCKSVK